MKARVLVLLTLVVGLPICLLIGCGKKETGGPVQAEWRASGPQSVSSEVAQRAENPALAPAEALSGSPSAKPSVSSPEPDGRKALSPAEPSEPMLQPGGVMGQPPKTAADPFVVPEGTPAELFKYLESLQFVQPPARDEKSLEEFRRKLGKTILTVSEKVMAQSDIATPEEMQVAAQLKTVALSILRDLGDAEAAKALESWPAELEKQGRPELAHAVRGQLLERKLANLDAPDEATLQQLAQEVVQHLRAAPAGREEALLAMQLCRMLEAANLPALLEATVKDMAEALAKSEDEAVRKFAKALEGMARRAALVGNALEISGVKLDGQPLDWSSYQGKVVLVTFWATWCAPCRAEIPHLLENYKRYHDRGFEIVAISVDDNREDVIQFVAQNNLPWTILFDQDAPGEKMAEKYGVLAIPEMILVGRDGNVVATGLRGPAIRQQLERLIGPAEDTSSDDQAPETVPPAPAPSQS
jgi:thiol-disulfide isomerase/thioredoxin